MSTSHPRTTPRTPVALVTGGSSGLGRALVRALDARGWRVVTDARDGRRLREVATPAVTTVVGDVTDPDHRAALAAAVRRTGRLDLLVHNASTLGPLPLRPLRHTDLDGLREAWATNVEAAHALTRDLADVLRGSDGTLVSVSSDAAVAHYPTWGAYAVTKAALDQLTLTWGEEEGVAAYAVDPGDMRTPMHQAAFPGEDISDRPDPRDVAPRLLALVATRPPSGRYHAAEGAGTHLEAVR